MDIPLWIEERSAAATCSACTTPIYKKHRRPDRAPHPLRSANLILHTVGAKTGKARDSTLTYARDGDDYLVVASKGGDPKAPGWYHNLKANPSVEINVGPKRFRVTGAARCCPTTPDYARLWKIVNDNNAHRYEGYQKRTSRPIPVVRLAPA